METKPSVINKVELLKDGEHIKVNMFQDGCACVYKCNGMYLMFEITSYGANEHYIDTYFENQLDKLVNDVFDLT